MRRRLGRPGRSRGLRTACCTGPDACSRRPCAPRTAGGRIGCPAPGAPAGSFRRKWGSAFRVLSFRFEPSGRGAAAADDVGGGFADVVDEPVLERLFGTDPAVAIAVGVDLLDTLAGLGRRELGQATLPV